MEMGLKVQSEAEAAWHNNQVTIECQSEDVIKTVLGIFP